MTYTKPKVVQEFEIGLEGGSDIDKDGRLTDNALCFLQKVMPDTVHRILPHVPPGRNVTIKITIEGDLV